VQGFHGVVKPFAETRPAWKVLRVLGNLLGLDGFQQETSDEVRAGALGDVATLPERLSNRLDTAVSPAAAAAPQESPGLERVADVPIYSSDSLSVCFSLYLYSDGFRSLPSTTRGSSFHLVVRS
jgi:NADH-quinone oxidoreductase subunit G